jgi:hypothetical protein
MPLAFEQAQRFQSQKGLLVGAQDKVLSIVDRSRAEALLRVLPEQAAGPSTDLGCRLKEVNLRRLTWAPGLQQTTGG